MIGNLFFYFFLAAFGLAVGSFISAYTFRVPRGISISKGRSFCDKCKKKIIWYDNIPLLSYLLLGGKCRNCGKKISKRYPIIEGTTALVFLTTSYLAYSELSVLEASYFGDWKQMLGSWSTVFFILLFTSITAVFITDFENKLIPDEIVFTMYILILSVLVVFYEPNLYVRLLTSFSAAFTLLTLHFITLGRGMGLGDVKLALVGGLFFGWPGTIIWLFLSFILGGVIGITLIILGKAKFGAQIPFGPFMISAFILTVLFGNYIGILIFNY